MQKCRCAVNTKRSMNGHWYIICKSKQLRKKPLARQVLGEHLVVFRDAQGQASVLKDRCAHRNMALSRGSVTNKGVRCSYHGWTYGSDGRCTDIPASCESCESYAKIKVPAYSVIEKQGVVWVWMPDSENPSKPYTMPLDFPMFDESGWNHWYMERHFEGNAFHCVENFLDVPHTAHVHRGLFRGDEENEVEIEITSGTDWIQAEFINEGGMDSWIGKLLVPKGSQVYHTDKFQLPYVTRVDYRMAENRQYIVMSQCTPIDDENTRVYTYMAYRFSPFGALVKGVFAPLSHVILNQDVRIIREQTEDLRRTGAPKFLYYDTDAIAKGIRQLLDGKSLEGKDPERKKIKA
ncbi:(Fe-S)-binding protein [Oceaniferula spumae]|uniref:(Fe-S)-binding protein n=2 Tax=Oceaniferula spumae TaxID=2979115 RepID=A0AAT9FJN8_9BACT